MWTKSPKVTPKYSFWAFAKTLFHKCVFYTLEMVNDSVFHDYAKTACLDSNGLKSSQPFSIFVHQYIWKKSIDTLDIFHGEKKKQAGFETTTFGLVWSVVPFTQSDSRVP